MVKTFSNIGHLYTGRTVLSGKTVVIEDQHIGKITDHFSSGELIDLQGYHLAPGFIDLQIYGSGGKSFETDPNPERILTNYTIQKRGGTTSFQITLATSSSEKMAKAIAACQAYWQQQGKGLLGLHLEGPYINPVKKGAHKPEYIQTPNARIVAELLEAGKGIISFMTVAPEMLDSRTLQLLLDSEIILSAGHSDATFAQAVAGFQQGIPCVTHLFNAMSQFESRKPGLVGATYAQKPWASIIADGIHCDYAVVKISKEILGERLFLITDQTTQDPEGEYTFTLQEDCYRDEKGLLAGSALTMIAAVKNCVQHVGIALDEALRMASTYPAEAMKMGQQLGRIEEGYVADLVIFDDHLAIKGIVKEGSIEWFA